MDIKLRFINRSNDGNKSEVVIYQKNEVSERASLAVAWKVIRYCGRDCYHPFIYPSGYEVTVTDEYGNFAPRIAVTDGQMVKLVSTPTGSRRLRCAGAAGAYNEVDVLNAMDLGSVDVCLFKDKRLMGVKTTVTPGQKAVFQYRPALWIVVASEVVQGQGISSAVLSNVATEISLIGIASADIVMTGGGGGALAGPYEFNLENIVLI